MLLGSVTSTITEWITGLVGDHAVYAVFVLMLVDAVFPAASELVMLYGGAVASGALTSSVVLFGERISEPAWAFVTVALSGTIGYTLGSLVGWAIGAYGGSRCWSGAGAGSTSAGRSSTAPTAGSSTTARGPSSSAGSCPSSAASSRSRQAFSAIRSSATSS